MKQKSTTEISSIESNLAAKVVDLTINYVPHPFQKTIHQDPTKYRVVAAGRRGGKTTLAIMECIQVALERADARVWYLSPTYRQSEMIAWKLLLKALPRELIKRTNNMKLEVELFNGSIIELKGADNEDSLRGVGLDFCVLDEYAYMKSHIWGMIIQPMFATTGGKALFIGTPSGKNHFYQMWLDGQDEKFPQYKSFHFKSIQSPYVDDDFIEQEKKRLPENVFRQEYESSFEDFTGLVYPEWNVSYHIIEPFNISPNWQRIVGIDPPESTGTMAVVFAAVDEEGHIIVYDEYYQYGKIISDHCLEIKPKINLEKDRILIDPVSANKQQKKEGSFYSLIDEFRDVGINPTLAERDKDMGLNRVREYLKVHPEKIHPYKLKMKGSPKVFVTRNCKNFIWEIERYHYSDRPETKMGILKPTPYKKSDHLMDAFRFVCTARPGESPSIKEEKKIGSKSLHAALEYDKRQKADVFA